MSNSERMRQTIENIKNAVSEDETGPSHLTGRDIGDSMSFNSVKHGEVIVDINPDDGLDLQTETPNIEISVKFAAERGVLKFTWDEARELSKALDGVTDLAEFG